jgi:hypothetical protein
MTFSGLLHLLFHWSVLLIGGWIVIVGLLMEDFPDWKKWPKDDPKRHQVLRAAIYVIVLGIIIESVQTVVLDVKAEAFRLEADRLERQIEQDKPENRPVRTISAYARILVKGDKYVRSPTFTDNWMAGISFIVGTNFNATNVLFSLSAASQDVQLVNILGPVSKNRTDREYDITFHQNHPVGNMPTDAGIGKPAAMFDAVDSLILSMPQFETLDNLHFSTNTDVLSGSVIVTLNSSLTWQFDIPPQKQKFGCITSERTTNAENKVEVKVLPVSVIDMTGHFVGFFDGK